jgi:hypothetical protein
MHTPLLQQFVRSGHLSETGCAFRVVSI